jgi:DNA-directed RNA polymerase subunit N (RpoN/RPB10)
MIIAPLCQSCGQPVGHLWPKYQKLVQKYAEEAGAKFNNDIMIKEVDGDGKKKDKKTPEFRALDTLAKEDGLNVERYCCRFAFLSNHDISSIIH